MDSDEDETTDRSKYVAYEDHSSGTDARPLPHAPRPRIRHFAAASTGTSMFPPTYYTRFASYIPPSPPIPQSASSSSKAADNGTTNNIVEQNQVIEGNNELLTASTKSSSPDMGHDLGIATVSNDGTDAAALVDCLPNMPSLLDANEEENIRSPIPPRRDVLQLPEDDNFRTRKRRMPPHSQQLVYRNFQQEGEMQELQHEKILDHHREHFDMELQNRHRLSPKRHRCDAQNSDGNVSNNRNASAGGGIGAIANNNSNNFAIGNLSGTNKANKDSGSGNGKTISMGGGDTGSSGNIISNALETEGISAGSDNATSARTLGHNIIGVRNINVASPHGLGYSISNANNSFRGGMYPLVRRSFTNERLDGVYRPLAHACSLNEARDIATAKNRWLLVNYLDNDNPRSHRLTTELYSPHLTKLATSRFFYIHTIYTNTAEGLRLQSFYSIKQAPYICILDPRTGEELYANRNAFYLQKMEYYTVLKTFIINHTRYPNMDNLTAEEKADDLEELLPDAFKPIKRIRVTTLPFSTTPSTLSTTPTSSSLTATPTSTVTKPSSIPEAVEEIIDSDESTNDEPFLNKIDMSEDDQIRQAILESLADKNVDKQCLSNDESSEQTQTDSSNSGDGVTKKNKCDKNTRNNSEDNLFDLTQSTEDSNGSTTDEPIPNIMDNGLDPATHMQIRLPDDTKHILSWPCTTKLLMLRKFLQTYVKQKTFKLLKPYPRTDVLQMDSSMTLRDAGLHPNVILTLHTDD